MISPSIYDKKYFFSTQCEGFEEYRSDQLSPIKKLEVEYLDLKKLEVFLDVGCGRGDVLAFLFKKGYKKILGIDYSAEAVKICKSRIPKSYKKNIVVGNARKMPYKNSSVDKILIGDVIEHMTYAEAVEMIDEAHRILKTGGKLVIHTAPNRFFSQYLYKIVRLIFTIMGFGKESNGLIQNIKVIRKYHIDEYSIYDLRHYMSLTRFKNYRVFIHPDSLRTSSSNYLNSIKKNIFVQSVSRIINNSFLLNWFGNDLFVVASK